MCLNCGRHDVQFLCRSHSSRRLTTGRRQYCKCEQTDRSEQVQCISRDVLHFEAEVGVIDPIITGVGNCRHNLATVKS